MFYLHASNKTEHLLQHLATLIEVDPRKNIFEKEYILIQSQGMERMISQYMADVFKSWCNFEYLLPLAFLQGIAERLGMEIMPDSFDRSVLCWRIEEKLHNTDNATGTLAQYLTGNNIGLKRYQLARQLANIFDQYQLMRPQMLNDWGKERLTTTDPSEIWQMYLWNQLITDESSGQHRGELLQKVINKLNTEELSDLLPRRISIFGLHIMPPLFLDYLNGMSKHCDVHLFLLSPCQSYWGDMGNRREELRKRVALREQGSAVDELSEENHPLLISMGQQGRLFQELLLDNVAFKKEITSYEDPFSTETPKVLQRLQSDLLAGTVSKSNYDLTGDNTIRIVSCHSRQRELAVLKDHILSLLHQDKSLQLRDIVVMAPDIQQYAPFISTVFEEIQHSIADRSLQNRNLHISAFAEYLRLLTGRFGWDEVFALLQKKQVFPNFALNFADLERLKNWIITAGIRWGLSGQTRKSAGFDFSENSWRDGLSRLLMGFMIDTDQPVEGVLPYVDIEGGEAKILGGICEFIELLERTALVVEHNYELQEWSSILLDYASQLFGIEDDKDLLELHAVLRELEGFGLFHQQEVEFEVIRQWFEDSFSEGRSASGFLRGQLTFCSMLPMRSIPFKAVCIIGMNHGEFPKIDRHATFDLMQNQPQPGDRSVRADDRYQFLEALLAARETLYISYVGQSIQNNEEIPPSVVVTELLETLEKDYSLKDIVVKHPLHPFSIKYFSNSSENLYSYSEENCQIATSLRKREEGDAGWWRGTIEEGLERINIADLLSFYRNPQLFFVQNCLGVRLGEESLFPEERETFAVEGLDSFIINHQILEKVLQDENLEDYRLLLSAEGRWPLGVPGDQAFNEKCDELTRFATIVKEEEMGQRLVDVEIDLCIGHYHLVGKLSNIYEGGVQIIKYTDLKGKDLLAAWIHHVICKKLDGESVTKLIMKDGVVTFDNPEVTQPGLEDLIVHYIEGCSRPSRFYIEPAFQYCRQKMSKKARVSPLYKAQTTLLTSIENGYEPAWSLLNSKAEIVVLDEVFENLCEQVMMPLWSVANGG